MTYRVESNRPLSGRLLPDAAGATECVVDDLGIALALAAKGDESTAQGYEVRVVHVPTGEVVYTKKD